MNVGILKEQYGSLDSLQVSIDGGDILFSKHFCRKYISFIELVSFKRLKY